MLACTCRKTSKKQANRRSVSSPADLLADLRLSSLQGSDLGSYAGSLIAAALPPGITMPGMAVGLGGFTIAANTDNSPNPSLPGDQMPSYLTLYYATPPQIWPKAPVALFIKGQGEALAVEPSDINQGSLGDCWMMTALGLLAAYGNVGPTNTTVIEQAFVATDPPGAVAPTHVTINLYQPSNPDNNTWKSSGPPIPQTVSWDIPVLQVVPVDPALPPAPAYVKSDNTGEYWPCMMEKAVAAAGSQNGLTGYAALNGGQVSTGMSIFTPGTPAWYFLSRTPASSDLFNAWNACMSTGISIGVTWKSKSNMRGLLPSHAYGVFGIVSVNGTNLALLRNPWGNGVSGNCVYNQNTFAGEWTGPWSDCSPQWSDPNNAAVTAACGYAGPRPDGMFWMSFDDIASNLLSYEVFVPDRADMRAVDLRNGRIPTAMPACSDTPNGWTDQWGNNCGSIVGAGYCQGGTAMRPRSFFSSYSSQDGNTPLTACCACGGGSTGNAFVPCNDVPNWQDKYRNNCSTFTKYGMCGGGQVLVPAAQIAPYVAADGSTPATACCACGGGVH